MGLRQSAKAPPLKLPSRDPPSQARRGISLVALMWNEGLDLREWLEFHRLAGIDHVYLYDDGSTDDSREIVRPYVSDGFVTYIPWSRFSSDPNCNMQRLTYAHAICTFGERWRWMAFIDLDEYLFAVNDESLSEALSRYEDIRAVVVPWHMYGYCGHVNRPSGLVIENYTQRLNFPPPPTPAGLLNWKSIVDPFSVKAIYSPHFFIHSDEGLGGYTENRVWINTARPNGWEQLTSNVFRLNHYFTKSKEDFIRRRSSGRTVVWRSPETQIRRDTGYAHRMDEYESVDDQLILRFAPVLHGLHPARNP